MPTKPVFSPAQLDVIRATARRIYDAKFAWMKRTKDRPGGQEAMALAIGVAQQSVSNLLKGTYNPGWKVATNIANLDGQTLEQLLAHVGEDEPQFRPLSDSPLGAGSFRNLTRCVEYHEDDHRWSDWTIAAARAGYFGEADFSKLEWETKLDALEKIMAKGRKAG